MIAQLTGSISAVRLDCAVLDVGGVGLLVRATPATLVGLRPGDTATLATTLVVREDSLTLFGFATGEERDVFDILQTVSGVGPRLALAMLAVCTPDVLRRAVATEDLTTLMKVPGIGRKSAQRIVLELGDRLGAPGPGSTVGPSRPAGVGDGVGPQGVDAQVAEALQGLGWAARAAELAVSGARQGLDGSEPEAADLLRAALRGLART